MHTDTCPEGWATSRGTSGPEYTVRVSERARRARLVMTEERGLEIVIPRRFDRRQIPGLVASKREWIERAAVRVAAKRRRLEQDPPRLPDRIALPAVGEEWVVEYREGGTRAGDPSCEPAGVCAAGAGRVAVREHPGRRLVVTGDVDDVEACRAALCRWLRRRAKQALAPRLAEIALQHRLSYGRVTVRLQRTRWASCSRQRTISVNAKLLFLQPEFVDYVLLHELCHTLDMNHSRRFWARLQAHDPECAAHRLLIKAAGAAVPTWVDHGLTRPDV